VREAPETLVHPVRTLEWGVADCDDLTILICSLLRGAKVPCRAAFVGWKQGPGHIAIRHVYPEAWLGSRWTALESVRPVRLGWNAADWRRRKGDRVRVETIGDGDGVEPKGTRTDNVTRTP